MPFDEGNIEKIQRRRLSIDTWSLLEDDGEEAHSVEEHVLSEQAFKQLIKSLTTDRERFMALALYAGFENIDISFMLSLHPSIITRGVQKMRLTIIKLKNQARI